MQAVADLRMAAACDEMRDAVERAGNERRERVRLERLMRWTDRLLDELERLNLSDVPELPQGWMAKLAILFSNLPFEFTPMMSPSPTPTEAIDVILDLQQIILALKSGARMQDLEGDRELRRR